MAARVLTFIIGHRHVGKSSFLRRVNISLPQARCLDLTAEVTRIAGVPLENLLREEGDSGLRVRERVVLDQLLKEFLPMEGMEGPPIYIELDPDFMAFDHPAFALPGTEVLWVRRRSDKLGRVLLGYPRLSPEIPPLQEYLERATFRERRFERVATEQLVLREGQTEITPEEDQWIRRTLRFNDGCQLLRKGEVAPGARFHPFHPAAYIVDPRELGSDGVARVADWIPEEKRLFRVSSEADAALLLQTGGREDRAHSAQRLPPGQLAVLSVFERTEGEALQGALSALEARAAGLGHTGSLKFEAQIEDWAELEIAHQWRMKDAARRVLLPRSKDGRWRWYHLAALGRQPFGIFVHGLSCAEPASDFPDLPQPFEWLRARTRGGEFGAFLSEAGGETQAAMAQDRWFRERGQVYLEVPVSAHEFEPALRMLESMGVTRLAVWGHLGELAYALCGARVTLRARRAGVVDTLRHGETGWFGDACSVSAFRKVAREWRRRAGVRDPRDPREVILVADPHWPHPWVREEFLQFMQWQVGQGAGEGEIKLCPDLVIWGVPRGAGRPAVFPPQNWTPRWVLDLISGEDSPGREYAQRCGARYLGGEVFEHDLAMERQQFWADAPTLLPALLGRRENRAD